MAYIPAISSDRIVDGTIVNADINASAAIDLSKLATDPLARANHTGTQAHTTISDFDAGVQTNRLDQMTAPTASVSFGSQNITSLAAGSASGHAVEFDQFNAALDGLSYKEPVVLATTANITLSGEQTIDGTLTSADRVLVKNQTATEDNGIYVTASGSWTRATDANAASEVTDGVTVWVESGTANGDSRYTQTLAVATLGTDGQTWAKTGAAGFVTTFDELTDVDLTGAADTAMLWNDNGTWKDTANATYDDDTGQMALATSGSSAGLLLGGDANLYRSAADILKTDDEFEIGINGGKNTLNLSDTTADVGITIGGDVTLYRSAADILKTDDAMTVASTFKTEGGRVRDTTAVNNAASPYTVLAADDIILVDASGGAVELDLPAAASSTGRIIGIKDQGGDALTNNITLDPNATENIDGSSTSFALDEDFMAVWIICDGTEWSVL